MLPGPHGMHLPYTELENHAPAAEFSVVLAHTPGGVIGRQGQLPWDSLPVDMDRFRRLTTTTHRPAMKNAIVMGRVTWESIHCRPLPGRLNIVVTGRPVVDGIDGVNVMKTTSLMDALRMCEALSFVDQVFVIGGAKLYEAAFTAPCREGIRYVFSTVVGEPVVSAEASVETAETVVSAKTETAVVDPGWWTGGPDSGFEQLWEHSPQAGVTFFTHGALHRAVNPEGWTSTPDPCIGYPYEHEEAQYLRLVHSILRGGIPTADRTGTGTLSQFGAQLRFSLRGGTLPLLTTKQTFFRGVAEELLTLFVPGCTDAKALSDRGVHIWHKNAVARNGDGSPDTDLGPVYGFQWRHFGAEYAGCGGSYEGKGVDQLSWVINEIRTNPSSRRLVVSAWNPVDIPAMALPPCHVMFQFYVRRGELSCHMTQRSADVGLGLPFNIASYALLTHLVAHATDLKPGELVLSLGDVHIYRDHEGALLEQYSRTPLPFCKLALAPDTPKDVFAIRPEHVSLDGYASHGKLAMPMSA